MTRTLITCYIVVGANALFIRRLPQLTDGRKFSWNICVLTYVHIFIYLIRLLHLHLTE